MTQSVSQAATIETWNSLARDYAQLLEKYSLFHVMAKKLLALAPVNPGQTIADVGTGTGLLAHEILKSCPDIEIHAIEPAQEMIKLVQKNVKGSNIYYHCLSAEAIATLPYRFDRIFSNATFHLVDLEQILPSLSQVLKPFGKITFNLWWHSFEETLVDNCSSQFRAVVAEILARYNLTPVESKPSRLPYKRSQIIRWTARSHLVLEKVLVDRESVPPMFFLDFMAMYSDRPHPDLTYSQRQDFFVQARNLLKDQEIIIVSTRFLLRKNA